jgi:hypothetical protein
MVAGASRITAGQQRSNRQFLVLLRKVGKTFIADACSH